MPDWRQRQHRDDPCGVRRCHLVAEFTPASPRPIPEPSPVMKIVLSVSRMNRPQRHDQHRQPAFQFGRGRLVCRTSQCSRDVRLPSSQSGIAGLADHVPNATGALSRTRARDRTADGKMHGNDFVRRAIERRFLSAFSASHLDMIPPRHPATLSAPQRQLQRLRTEKSRRSFKQFVIAPAGETALVQRRTSGGKCLGSAANAVSQKGTPFRNSRRADSRGSYRFK